MKTSNLQTCYLPSTMTRIFSGSSFVSRKSLTSFLSCSFSPMLRKPRRLSRDASLEFLTVMMKRSSTSWNNSPFAQPYGSRRVKAVVFPEPAAPNTTASRWCASSLDVNSAVFPLRNENFSTGWMSSGKKGKYTVESGKNVTFFEQLFCFYQLVLVVWNTFGAKFKLPFISWVKQNWHFLRQCRKNCPSPIWGDFWGKRGPGKIISPVADSAGACTARLFLLDHRTTCTVFPVFAMFAMTTMADSCTLTPASQVTSIKAGWAHFSLPFERLIF